MKPNASVPPALPLDRDVISETATQFADRQITTATVDTNLIEDVMTFVQETFPLANVQGQFIKLAQEYQELQQASNEEVPEELADVIFVAIGIAALADINIAKVLRDKLNKNKARKWQHVGFGVYQHLKE